MENQIVLQDSKQLKLTLKEIRDLLPVIDFAVLHYFEGFKLDGSQTKKVKDLTESLNIDQNNLGNNLFILIELQENFNQMISSFDTNVLEIQESLKQMRGSQDLDRFETNQVQSKVDKLFKNQIVKIAKQVQDSKQSSTISQIITPRKPEIQVPTLFDLNEEIEMFRDIQDEKEFLARIHYYNDLLVFIKNDPSVESLMQHKIKSGIVNEDLLLNKIPFLVSSYLIKNKLPLIHTKTMQRLGTALYTDLLRHRNIKYFALTNR